MKRWLYFVLALMLCACTPTPKVHGYALLDYPIFEAYLATGAPCSGCKLYTYEAGTTTEKTTYKTRTATAHTNPIILNTSGRPPSDVGIFGSGSYKFVLKDSDDTTLWTLDNVRGYGGSDFVMIADYGGDLDAAVADISTTQRALYIDETATLSANTSIPRTLDIHMLEGGTINQSTYSLTFASRSQFHAAPDDQIFTGTGTILFTEEATKANPAYAEWWGIDGTADEAQINLALTAAKHVELLPRGYSTAANIQSVSNGSLLGTDWTTILTVAANSVVGVDIEDSDNFELGMMKIVQTSRTGGVGAQLDNAEHCYVHDLWLYDSSVHAFRIRNVGGSNTVQYCNIERIFIDSGCSSAAFSVSSESTTDSGLIQHITIDDLVIYDCDGTGITNNANKVAGSTSNVVKDIRYSNVYINSPGDASDECGFTASGGAEYISLDQFYIVNAYDAGLKMESVNGFQITNGQITGCDDQGVVLGQSASLATVFGARYGTISNVGIFSNEKAGLQVGTSSAGGSTVRNITISSNQIYANGVTDGGNGIVGYFSADVVVDGNQLWDNGKSAQGNGDILLPASGGNSYANARWTITNNSIRLTANGVQDYGISIESSATDVTIKGNILEGTFVTEPLNIGSGLFDELNSQVDYMTDATAVGTGNETLSAAELLGGIIDDDPEGAATWTTATAASIVGAISGASVGHTFRVLLFNDSNGAAETVTIAGGSGVTMHGENLTLSEGTCTVGELIFRLTNVGSGTEAVDCYILGSDQS